MAVSRDTGTGGRDGVLRLLTFGGLCALLSIPFETYAKTFAMDNTEKEDKKDSSAQETAPGQAGESATSENGGTETAAGVQAGNDAAASAQAGNDAAASAQAGGPAEDGNAGAAGADPRDAEIAALKKSLKEAEDRVLRARADFDNYRKRSIREREEFAKMAAGDVIKAILPTADNLARALAAIPEDNPLAKGVKLSYDSFVAALGDNGAQKIETAGKTFDPNLHEALAQMPSDTVPAGDVIEEFRAGWTLNGRLLRAAQVVVSSGPAPADGADAK